MDTIHNYLHSLSDTQYNALYKSPLYNEYTSLATVGKYQIGEIPVPNAKPNRRTGKMPRPYRVFQFENFRLTEILNTCMDCRFNLEDVTNPDEPILLAESMHWGVLIMYVIGHNLGIEPDCGLN